MNPCRMRPGRPCQPTKKQDEWVCPACGMPTDPPGPRYDPDLLEEFVRAASRAGDAHREAEEILAIATARMEKGELEYGPVQFWSADCAQEAAEEGIDAINWSFFEYTKSLAGKGGPDPDDDARDLALIAACGASIYAAAARIRHRRNAL